MYAYYVRLVVPPNYSCCVSSLGVEGLRSVVLEIAKRIYNDDQLTKVGHTTHANTLK